MSVDQVTRRREGSIVMTFTGIRSGRFSLHLEPLYPYVIWNGCDSLTLFVAATVVPRSVSDVCYDPDTFNEI